MKQKLNLISFFSGAGGFDLGFEETGRWQTIVANDVHPMMIKTMKINQGVEIWPSITFLEGTKIVEKDVEQLKLDELIGNVPIDLFLGGPPCQSFSVMGKHGGYDDNRGSLIYTFGKMVEKFRPRSFLFENVPNIKSPKWEEEFNKYCELFRSNGLYEVRDFILNCSEYGAATIRRRVFVLGILSSEKVKPTPPPPTHFKSSSPSLFSNELPWVTVRDALKGLPPPSYDFSFPDLHFAPRHRQEIIDRFKNLGPGETDKKRKRDRLSWDEPSLTLMAGGEAGGTRNHIHPEEPRELTPRECARLHGFPDAFTFAGNKSQIAIQIANSVPVPMAKAWGQHIANLLASGRGT
jgi:DNA (cytosine-5)-methyltransferase 1